MKSYSIRLGDGLCTLTAACEEPCMNVRLNANGFAKHSISRLLTHTVSEYGSGVFTDSSEERNTQLSITDAAGKVFYFSHSLSDNPREYLEQVMRTVNKAREFYNLPLIKWEVV